MNEKLSDRVQSGNIVCLYHNDMDGKCSAAIVRRKMGKRVALFPVDYGMPIPWDAINNAEKVVLVDFSLPLDSMNRIRATADLTWIDHHKTAIEALASLKDIAGTRDLEDAACVLTWKTYFPDQSVPDAVVWIGDRDVWRFACPETAAFNAGIYQENCNPENDALWGQLLADDRPLIDELITRGEILHRARLRNIRGRVEHFGFEVQFEGHKTLAVNFPGSGDIGEYIRKRGYEIGYCYVDAVQNSRLVTLVSLYSDQVDVSEIALKFGGGGHKGAAGYVFERNGSPFPEGAQFEMKAGE